MQSPSYLINENKFVAYSLDSIEMFFFEIDFNAPKKSKLSSDPLLENKNGILAVNKKQIFIFYKTAKGLYPRMSGRVESLKFDKDGFFSKVSGSSEDFGLIEERFFIEWPKRSLFSFTKPTKGESVLLSVSGNGDFEPEISSQWKLNNCAFLGEITVSEN
jgi:hypothetical protein